MISRREAAYPSRRTSGSDRLRAIISEAMRLNWLILNISFIFSWFSLGITTGFPPSPGPSRGLARASAVDTDKHTAQTEDAGECKSVSLWSHVYVRQYTLTVSPGQSSLLFVVALVALAEVEQNEHVQHHPHQRGGQNHFTVGEPPHPKSVTREREREREQQREERKREILKLWLKWGVMVSPELHTQSQAFPKLCRGDLYFSSYLSAFLLTPLNLHPSHSSTPDHRLNASICPSACLCVRPSDSLGSYLSAVYQRLSKWSPSHPERASKWALRIVRFLFYIISVEK